MSSSAHVPVACKESSAAIQAALRRAPGDVRVGGTRLSDCFARASDQADVQSVGLSFLPAAERLASDARSHAGGEASLRLGFLIGATHRGADRAQGIYSEFVRRLESELNGVDVQAPAYRTGRRAGLDHG